MHPNNTIIFFYCNGETDRQCSQKLLLRKALFCDETKTKSGIRITMVTTYGVLHNKHYGIVDDEVTLDDLFQ